MSWVKEEQDSLVEAFRTTHPDAPTLCEGWNVCRLLAHLTQREHSLIARIVDSVARKPPGQEPRLNKLTSQAGTPQGYDALIDRFTQGAPRWSPMSWAAAGSTSSVPHSPRGHPARRRQTGRAEGPARGETGRGLATARPARHARAAQVADWRAPGDAEGQKLCREGR